MSGKLPPDLLVVVFGPVAIVAIALGLGSFIFRIAQMYGPAADYGAGVSVVVGGIVVLLIRLRRR